MKLTSKGRYAVMALVDLARFDNINPVSLRDISLRQGISLDFLEQIFSKLKKNQIVKSIRGNQGGYILSKDPSEIKLTNIFNAVDEKVKTVQCKKNLKKVVTVKLRNVLHTIYGMNLRFILILSLKIKA
jgi:Rrf2 family iron-sulfur cluster assembly transcriptional regulator